MLQDQSECTNTGMCTLDESHKPLFLKELHRLWNGQGLPWPKGYYSCINTLLIDDSPYKALRNPVIYLTFVYFLCTSSVAFKLIVPRTHFNVDIGELIATYSS